MKDLYTMSIHYKIEIILSVSVSVRTQRRDRFKTANLIFIDRCVRDTCT